MPSDGIHVCRSTNCKSALPGSKRLHKQSACARVMKLEVSAIARAEPRREKSKPERSNAAITGVAVRIVRSGNPFICTPTPEAEPKPRRQPQARADKFESVQFVSAP